MLSQHLKLMQRWIKVAVHFLQILATFARILFLVTIDSFNSHLHCQKATRCTIVCRGDCCCWECCSLESHTVSQQQRQTVFDGVTDRVNSFETAQYVTWTGLTWLNTTTSL
jgi:hypothetical protein